MVQIIDRIFRDLKINITVKINNRKILSGIAELVGETERITDITVAIDKLDKIGKEGVRQELIQKGISEQTVSRLEPILGLGGSTVSKLNELGIIIQSSQVGMKGIAEMEELFGYLASESLAARVELDLSLARGLNYYTGAIIEVKADYASIGSICGGGRYDLLIEELGGRPTPGVGFAAGMERILLACENEKSLNLQNDSIDAYLIRIDSEIEIEVAKIASELRRENISCDYDYLNRSVKAQMREANKHNAKFVVFVGGDEYKRGELNVKNLSNGEQQLIKLEDFEKLKSIVKS